MTAGRFAHAIAGGEGITLLVPAADAGGETLAVGSDPAAVARVVDLAAAGAAGAPDLELAVRVRDEEELERALEELDPEILVLAGTLDDVLDLLPDVPAGKLVVADLPALAEDDVEELERAGFDAVVGRGGEPL